MSLKSVRDSTSLSPIQISIGLTALQCVIAAPVLLRLRSAETVRSTKNGETASLTPKAANVVMYGPSAAIAYWASTLDGASKLSKLLLTHFGKKTVELFVVKQSSSASNGDEEDPDRVPTSAAVQTSAFYGIGTYLVLTQAVPVPTGVDYGQIVFWLGQLGSGFHKYLLENNSDTKNRSLPSQGLFGLNIAAPHYLCEIVAWLGLAASTGRTNPVSYVQAAMITAMLAVKAKNLNDRYPQLSAARSGESTKRWNLIPYIY